MSENLEYYIQSVSNIFLSTTSQQIKIQLIEEVYKFIEQLNNTDLNQFKDELENFYQLFHSIQKEIYSCSGFNQQQISSLDSNEFTEEDEFQFFCVKVLAQMSLVSIRFIHVFPNSQFSIQFSYLFKENFNPIYNYYKSGNAYYTKDSNKLPINQYNIKLELLGVTEEYQTFFDSIKVGQVVDALKVKKHRSCWSRAIVLSLDPIKIKFINDKLTQIIKQPDYTIFKQNTYCSDQEWNFRNNIQEGDLIDGCDDNNNVWYKCIVLSKKQEDEVDKIKFGFRYYDEDGPNKDETGSFYGWSKQYDEEINCTDPKIAQLNTFAKKCYPNASQQNEEEQFDDANDFIQEIPGKKIYAVIRNVYLYKSVLIRRILQQFGENQGFDMIIKVINQEIAIESLDNILSGLQQCGLYFHREFCYQYIPLLWKTVKKNLQQANESKLRGVTQEHIESIQKTMEVLLKRVYSIGEKNDFINNFLLNFSLKCYQAPFLGVKQVGLSLINSITQKICQVKRKQILDYSDINKQYLVVWMKINQLNRLLFQKGNYQLIQQTSSLFDFFISQKVINEQDIFDIFEIALNSKELEKKLALYKIIKETSITLSENLKIQIVSKFKEYNIQKEDLEFISDINQQNYLSSTQNMDSINSILQQIYWNIINTSDNQDIINLVINNFSEVIIKQKVKEFIDKCIQKIEENHNVSWILKLLDKCINSLSIMRIANEVCQSEAKEILVKDKHLFQLLNKHVIYLKQKKDKKYVSQQIEDVFEFIESFLKSYSEQIELKDIFDFWDIMINDYTSITDQSIFYKFLENLVQNLQSYCTNNQEVQDFFMLKVCKHVDKLNEEGFNMFKSFFIYLNHFMNIIQVKSNWVKQQSNDKFYSNCYWSSNNMIQIKTYKVQRPFQEIYGYENLLELIQTNQNQSISQLGIEFIEQVFEDSEEQQHLDSFYDQLLEEINEEDQKPLQIQRNLQILQSFFEKQEYKGLGNLLYLTQIVPFENIQLNIIDDFSYMKSKQIKVYINSNQTLFQLLQKVSNHFETTFDQCQLTHNDIVLKQRWNGKTIAQLNIRDEDQLTLKKIEGLPIEEEELVLMNNQINPKAIRVFKYLFNKYAEQQLEKLEQDDNDLYMNANNIAKFILMTIGDHCDASDPKVKDLLMRFDKDGDGCLSQDDFVQFYSESSISKSDVVWSNLNTNNIRKDLRLPQDEELVFSYDQIPAYRYSLKQEVYMILFKQLENREINEQIWRFLERMPLCNQQIFEELEVNENPYKNLYQMYQIYSTLEQVEDTRKVLQFINENIKKLQSENQQDQLVFKRQLFILQSIYVKLIQKEVGVKSFSNLIKIMMSEQKKLGNINLTLRVELSQDFENMMNLSIDKMRQYFQLEDIKPIDNVIFIQSQMIFVINKLINPSLELQKELMIQGLLTSSSVSLRQSVAFYYQILSQVIEDDYETLRQIVTSMIENISSNDSEYNQSSIQYYELLCHLLQQIDQKQVQINIDMKDLTQQVYEQILNNEFNDNNEIDEVLLGLINLLLSLINNDQHLDEEFLTTISQNLFINLLFSKQGNIKAFQSKTREISYKLIQKIIQKNNNVLKSFLDSTLLPFIQTVQYKSQFNYQPTMHDGNQYGFLGIKNLGCICYISSIVQQLFQVKPFRQAILALDDGQKENTILDKQNRMVDDNVLHQFQNLFAFLNYSTKNEFNPSDFCLTLKDWDGQPINVLLQQDSQEFLNSLFDKIEDGIKQTPYKNIINDVFGGSTVSQMTCQSCKNKNQKEEIFNNLSLEVSNKDKIEESLKFMIKEEHISDYNCSECNQKVELEKRVFLNKLPNILILHLKRIIFDIQTCQNIKVNSKFEFQEDLNVYDYTIDKQKGIINGDMDDYSYRLKGVVIHQGYAEQGHYTSIINTNDINETENWLEFDDNKVNQFNKDHIKGECFGGEYNQDSSKLFKRRENNKNGYMLVYEKIKKKDIKLYFENDEQIEQFENQSKFTLQDVEKDQNHSSNKENQNNEQQEMKDELIVKNLKYQNAQELKIQNNKIYVKVQLDNQNSLIDQCIFNSQFYQFIEDIIEQQKLPTIEEIQIQQYEADKEQRSTLIYLKEIISHLCYKILFRAFNNQELNYFIKNLKVLIKIIPENVLFYLQKFTYARNNQIKEILYNCPDKQVKYHQQILINIQIQTAVNFYEIENLSIDEEEETRLVKCQTKDMLQTQKKKLKQYVHQFLFQYEQSINQTSKGKWFWEFWYTFANSSQTQLKFLINQQFPQKIAELYTKKFDNTSYNYMNSKKVTRNELDNVFNIILHCFENMNEEDIHDQQFIYNYDFWIKSIMDPISPKLLGKLIILCCRNNLNDSQIVATCLLKALQQERNENVQFPANCINYFLRIDDEYKQERIKMIIGQPSVNLAKFKSIEDVLLSTHLQDNKTIYTYKTSNLTNRFQSLLDKVFQNSDSSFPESSNYYALYDLLCVCNEDQEIFQYIFNLKSCMYNCKNIFECFEFIISNYHEKNKQPLFWGMDQIYKQCKQQLDLIAEKLEKLNKLDECTQSEYFYGHAFKVNEKVLYEDEEDNIKAIQEVYDIFAIENFYITNDINSKNAYKEIRQKAMEDSAWNCIFYQPKLNPTLKKTLKKWQEIIWKDNIYQYQMLEKEMAGKQEEKGQLFKTLFTPDLKLLHDNVYQLIFDNDSDYDYEFEIQFENCSFEFSLSRNSKIRLFTLFSEFKDLQIHKKISEDSVSKDMDLSDDKDSQV